MEIEYKEVKNLNFKRTEVDDTIFYNQYGYDCFLMTLKISKRYYFDWDCVTRKVEFIKEKKGYIKNRVEIDSLETLQAAITFFKGIDVNTITNLEINGKKFI